jgi:hypothetical protein
MDDKLRDQLNHADLLLKEARKHASHGLPMTASLTLALLRTHLLTIENDLMDKFSEPRTPTDAAI